MDDGTQMYMRSKFDPAPITDEELKAGRLITKSQHARTLVDEIKRLLNGGVEESVIWSRLDQLARMVKDDEPEEPEDGSEE